MEKSLKAQIFHQEPQIKSYHKDSPSQEYDAISYQVDTEGKIISVTSETGEEVLSENLQIFQNYLYVPGVGYLRPGTKVWLDTNPYDKYTLCFGWHTNISNQTIFSWFLRPYEENVTNEEDQYMSSPQQRLFVDKTVYLEDIDHLCKVATYF